MFGFTAIALIQTLHAQSFVHPGCMSTLSDFARMQSKVNAGAHPWIDSYNLLIANNGADSNYVNHAQTQITRSGSGGNYNYIFWDANAAYELGIRWRITGDANYANAAIRIFNAWVNTCTNITGDPNAQLIALNGYQFACAAENLKGYSGWNPADLQALQHWFRYGPQPGVTNGWWVGSPYGFLQTHWGQCSTHDWANWDLANMDDLLAIAVFCDDRTLFNDVINYYKTGYLGGQFGNGNGTAYNVVYHTHPGYLGQWQESGRDQGHTMMGIPLLATFCEIAWNQGVDLFSYNTNELLAAAEYSAKYNCQPLTNVLPYVAYKPCDQVLQQNLASASRGNARMGWDLIYNHYVNRWGMSAPWTAVEASQVRPEGEGDNDVLGYTTLTHYLDPIATNSIAPISYLVAQSSNTTITLSWWGSAYADSYNVKRAAERTGTYTTIASVPANTLFYQDAGLTPGKMYYYKVSAVVGGVEHPDSVVISATPSQRLGGTWIGSAGAWDGISTGNYAFDGGMKSYYDAANSSGDWTGLDLGAGKVITGVAYCPRLDFSGRMVNGQFQGANVSDFSSGVVTLFTVTNAPADTSPPSFTYQTITNANAFRYVRYIGPSGAACDVAEIQFFGVNPGSLLIDASAGANYKLVNRNSGDVLDVSGGSMADGADVIQWPWSGSNNQRWQFVNLGVGSGFYKVQNVNSGKNMDINGASTANGANLIQYTDNGTTAENQQFTIFDAGSGYYKLIDRNSGKVLDISGASLSNGAPCIQWSDNGGNNQMWQVIHN